MGSSAPPAAARTGGPVGGDPSIPARRPAAPLSAGDRAALRAGDSGAPPPTARRSSSWVGVSMSPRPLPVRPWSF